MWRSHNSKQFATCVAIVWFDFIMPGVPNPNGATHATEIANFALEINTLIRKMAYSSKITIPTQLQLGASSGMLHYFVL